MGGLGIPIRRAVRIRRDAVRLGQGRGQRSLHVAVGLDAGFPLVDEGVVVEGAIEGGAAAVVDELRYVAADGELVGWVQEVFARLLALVEALELQAEVGDFVFEALQLDLRLAVVVLFAGEGAQAFELPEFALFAVGECHPG